MQTKAITRQGEFREQLTYGRILLTGVLSVGKLLVTSAGDVKRFRKALEVPPELPFIVGSLQRWCHDLVLTKAARQIRYNPDCAQILHTTAAKESLPALLAFVRELQAAALHLEHPLNPRLAVERCLIGYKRVFNIAE